MCLLAVQMGTVRLIIKSQLKTLYMQLNCMFSHGCCPEGMHISTLIPIPKRNKQIVK